MNGMIQKKTIADDSFNPFGRNWKIILFLLHKSHFVPHGFYSGNVFLRLLPVMREVETVSLPSVLGQRLYDHVVEVFGSSTPVTSIGDTTIEELRLRCVRYVVTKSVAQLVRQTGSLTDRGLYFENVEKAGESGDTLIAAGQQRAAALAAQAESSAVQYMTQLQNFIALHIASMFGGRESDVLKRDNEHKHSVWL